ncbi:MAG TPA: NCS2 family permease [Gaiellaceae bacterium]|jgi:AGZA family xanthine/uracil permease-like MFS transporter
MATMAAEVRGSALERRFRFAEQGTTLARDTMAGVTTFIVMSYIIFLNPIILSFTGVKGLEGKGLPFNGVLTATCVVAGVMTIIMGLYTNRAYAIAPGLGLNAVVAFQLVATEGLSFPAAMGLILLEGAVVTVFVLTGLREQVMRAIPLELKKAIAIGIGLFIAFIGLFDSGLVARGTGTPVTLGSFTTWPILVTIVGLVITIGLRARGFRGDLLVGIIGTTIIATLINWGTNYTAFTTPGVARWPSKIVDSPNWSLFGNFNFDAFSKLGVISALVWVFALFLSDFFDTMGTLVGVGKQAGYLDKNGDLPDMKKPLLVDSLAAMAGGASSTSSATTYIESGAGVGAGGRTGWVAVIAGALFLPFIFIAPLIGMVPAQATAAALIIVGYLMISSLTEAEEDAEPGTKGGGIRLAGIDFHDLAIGLPAALVIIIMPLTYSITNGIGFGFIAYTLIRAAGGEWRKIHPLMWAVSAAFTLYFFVPLLQTHVSWI